MSRFVRVLSILLGAAGVFALSGPLFAQAYPAKPVRLIVPYAAGGFSDVLARTLAQKMSEGLGQQVVVENRTGASTIIGADAVAKSAPDGYTLFFATGTALNINQHLFSKLPYNPEKDFVPVGKVAVLPYVLLAHPAVPANSFKDLIAYAKANPGKVNFADPGNGTAPHLAVKILEQSAGVSFESIHYKGNAPATVDLLAGQVHLLFDGLAVPEPHIKSGKLKILAVASLKRFPSLPNVPAIAESYPGFEASTWYCIMAPAGTSKEIVNRINTEIQKYTNDPANKERMLAQGAILEGGAPEQLAAYIKAETERWGTVIKKAGIKLD
ncbi:MAG: tripartite tricarboxylate transporter substrate binding protein [Betaproteobacteria bacterium]|nr:tripartite tricarboxylate transporter substrate binding protein [Betaproteobacteria bacterium]